MNWLSTLISDTFGGVVRELGDAIDKNVTSDEEKGKLRNELATIQANLQTKIAELQAEADKRSVEDRSSARVRESEIAKAGKANYIMPILAALAVILVAGLTYFILTHTVAERDLVNIILGAAIAQVKDIYGYYFGSSYGSTLKNNLLGK